MRRIKPGYEKVSYQLSQDLKAGKERLKLRFEDISQELGIKTSRINAILNPQAKNPTAKTEELEKLKELLLNPQLEKSAELNQAWTDDGVVEIKYVMFHDKLIKYFETENDKYYAAFELMEACGYINSSATVSNIKKDFPEYAKFDYAIIGTRTHMARTPFVSKQTLKNIFGKLNSRYRLLKNVAPLIGLSVPTMEQQKSQKTELKPAPKIETISPSLDRPTLLALIKQQRNILNYLEYLDDALFAPNRAGEVDGATNESRV